MAKITKETLEELGFILIPKLSTEKVQRYIFSRIYDCGDISPDSLYIECETNEDGNTYSVRSDKITFKNISRTVFSIEDIIVTLVQFAIEIGKIKRSQDFKALIDV